MTREEFDALVQRLEVEAKADPKKYQRRVGQLAVLGYAYIFAVLALLIGVLALLVLLAVRFRAHAVTAKLGFVLLALIAAVLRSLWVRIEAPEGIELTPQQAGPLFAAVEEIGQKLQARRPDHILLTDDFNAAAAQRPRLGVFGWHKHYLILGLPFLQAMPPDYVRAVIAHEFGHLSQNHARFSGWIYRVRASWSRLLDSLEQQGRGSFLFSKFFEWYAPFFAAYSFVLARADEYVADRCAAEVVGARTAADALVQTNLAGAFLSEKFWPDVYRQAAEQAAPPAAVFGQSAQLLRLTPPAEQTAKWFDHALKQKSDSTDTHPSLTERLAALGQEARLPAANDSGSDRHNNGTQADEISAAAYFLGDSLPALEAELSRAWEQSVSEAWVERHRELQEARERLRALEDKAGHETLSSEELWQRAEWTEEIKDEETALPLYRESATAQPEHAPSHFAVGRILLAREDETGMAHIERAMELEPQAVLPGCELIYNFLTNAGRDDEARLYYKRATEQAELLEKAGEERSRLGVKDKYAAHGLPEEKVAALREQLARHEEIGEAYLVRKEVQHFADKPLYVLGITASRRWYQFENEEHQAQVVARFMESLEFEADCYVLPLSSTNARLKKIMRKIPGAKIWSR